MDKTELTFYQAMEHIYPELPDLGVDQQFCEEFRVLVRQARSDNRIYSDIRDTVNHELVMVDGREKAHKYFNQVLESYRGKPISTTRSGAIAYKADEETADQHAPSAQPKSQPAQIFTFPEKQPKQEKSQEIDSNAEYLLGLLERVFASEKGQRAELFKDLDKAFDNFLEEHGVPLEKRNSIKQPFMVAMHATLHADENDVALPKRPPEMWEAGQGETSIDFLQRVYGQWLEAEVLTYPWLRKNDERLFGAIKQSLRRGADVENVKLPKAESDLIDKKFQKYVSLYGLEELEEIFSLMGTMKKRGYRSPTNEETNTL